MSRLVQHSLFGSRLESDVFSLPLAEREQWFELCIRFETVSTLDYQCQRLADTSGAMSLDAQAWWEIELRLPAMRRQLEPGAVAQLIASIPATWRKLLDDLRAVIFEWSRSQWPSLPLEVCLRIFLAEHRNAAPTQPFEEVVATLDACPNERTVAPSMGAADIVGVANPNFSADSPDYTQITFRGEKHHPTQVQASVIEVIDKARRSGIEEVPEESILKAIGRPSSHLKDIFRNSPLWNTLIVPGKTKGNKRLKV